MCLQVSSPLGAVKNRAGFRWQGKLSVFRARVPLRPSSSLETRTQRQVQRLGPGPLLLPYAKPQPCGGAPGKWALNPGGPACLRHKLPGPGLLAHRRPHIGRDERAAFQLWP